MLSLYFIQVRAADNLCLTLTMHTKSHLVIPLGTSVQIETMDSLATVISLKIKAIEDDDDFYLNKQDIIIIHIILYTHYMIIYCMYTKTAVVMTTFIIE